MKKHVVYSIKNGFSQEPVFIGDLDQCVDFAQSYGWLYDDLVILDDSPVEDVSSCCCDDCTKCDLFFSLSDCGYERSLLSVETSKNIHFDEDYEL